jgi:hypothetical protein
MITNMNARQVYDNVWAALILRFIDVLVSQDLKVEQIWGPEARRITYEAVHFVSMSE